MQEVAQLINMTGFPIASFILVFAFLKYVFDKYNTQLAELTKAVNNNTVVLTQLVEKMNNVDKSEQ